MTGRSDKSEKDQTDEGKGKAEDDAKSIEEVETTRKAGSSGKGGIADRKKMARTKTWPDMFKGLKSKDKLETANLDKSANESERADSVEWLDWTSRTT